MLLANANEDAGQADAYLRTFAGQRVDGLLFSPQDNVSPQLAATLACGLPVVLPRPTVEGVDAPLLRHGQRPGRAAGTCPGCNAEATATSPSCDTPTISTGAERRAAYLAGRATHGVSTDDRLLDAGDFLAGGAAQAMGRVIDRGVPFTAVFGANGQTTLGAVRALRERYGAEQAARIEVVSFDDLDWFEFASPPISAVRNDASAIGRLGVRGLLDLLAGRQAVGQRIATTFHRPSSERQPLSAPAAPAPPAGVAPTHPHPPTTA